MSNTLTKSEKEGVVLALELVRQRGELSNRATRALNKLVRQLGWKK